jgi:hypothetical protein
VTIKASALQRRSVLGMRSLSFLIVVAINYTASQPLSALPYSV